MAVAVVGDSEGCSKWTLSTRLGSERHRRDWVAGGNRTTMQEDGGARCALPRYGLQIGMTSLSFDSKEITIGDRWLSLEKLSNGYGFVEKGLLRRREKKKKRIGGKSVSLSVMKKGLWHAVGHSGHRCGRMLCFVGKQRSQFEKSTGTSSGKHRNSPKVTTVRPPEAEVPDVVEDVMAAGEGALDRNSPKEALGPKMESSSCASADKHPLLHRIGGRGGWEMESLGYGVGETTQAINSDLTSFTSSGRRDDVGRLVSISLILLAEEAEERHSWTASSAEVIAGGSKRLHSNSRGPRLRLKKRVMAVAEEERRELSFDNTVACSRVRWDLLLFDNKEKACSRQAALIP
ncbi:hypothetical protein B296_00004812 [Ensete ventricosum]|uniref:Uncharacterized protein n=1 Tax=Ensete ventricosum TaxID=4639 RepID=A0A427A1M3_ENSVE|nr:hypothetical protein B296_00004812 [Ensete ventricosum]